MIKKSDLQKDIRELRTHMNILSDKIRDLPSQKSILTISTQREHSVYSGFHDVPISISIKEAICLIQNYLGIDFKVLPKTEAKTEVVKRKK